MGRKSSGKSDQDDSTDVVKAAQDLLSEVENHYYYEEKALQLNIVVCNRGAHSVGDVRIELGFPKIEDFDIADRVYTSPFDKRASSATRNNGYPTVKKRDKAIYVRSTIGVLEPNKPVPALKCALRLAVGPGAQKKKIAVNYVLRRNEERIGQGRLKIKFGKVSA